MKKSSLLALSMVSLVALVGCGKNAAPKKDASKVVLEDFFSLTFGKEALKYADVQAVTADSEFASLGWYEEDALNQYIGAVGFTLAAGTTLQDCFDEIFVGTAEEPAEFAPFLDKYEEDILVSLNPAIADSGAYFSGEFYIGEYVEKNDEYVGVKYTDLYFQGQIIPAGEGEENDQLVVLAGAWYFEMEF